MNYIFIEFVANLLVVGLVEFVVVELVAYLLVVEFVALARLFVANKPVVVFAVEIAFAAVLVVVSTFVVVGHLIQFLDFG